MDLSLVCIECGSELEASVSSQGGKIMVDRCECCDDAIQDTGHKSGYDDGYEDAVEKSEKTMKQYQGFLDRLGINYNPENEEE